MKLIVGLGNIGPSYALTRHNIGFMILDILSSDIVKKSCLSLVKKTKIENQDVLLAKPQTQMNLSGKAVQSLLHFYKISIEDLLVIHDDIDLDFLSMKFQKNRGPGGNNGILSIHEILGHNRYLRLKLGVGRPPPPQSASSYVLSPFAKTQLGDLEDFLLKATQAVKYFIVHGEEKAGNKYNQKKDLK